MGRREPSSARRVAGILTGIALLVGAALVALVGLFLVSYEHHGGGESYVEIGGRQVDTDVVGAVGLVAAVAVAALGVSLLRASSRRR